MTDDAISGSGMKRSVRADGGETADRCVDDTDRPTCDDCSSSTEGEYRVEGEDGVFCLSHALIRRKQAEGNPDYWSVDTETAQGGDQP